MNLFEGLYTYEIVLAAMGVVLFLVLMKLLMRQVTEGKPYNGLLVFMLLPIAMVGWPSIKSIEIKDGVITLEKDTDDLQNNPGDQAVRQKVQQQVEELSQRPFANPTVITSLARAQLELGNHTAAAAAIEKALQADPDSKEANALSARIKRDQPATNSSGEAGANPSGASAKKPPPGWKLGHHH